MRICDYKSDIGGDCANIGNMVSDSLELQENRAHDESICSGTSISARLARWPGRKRCHERNWNRRIMLSARNTAL